MVLLSTSITEALAARLRGCTAGAGYASDVGLTVHVGRLKAGAVEAPCIYLLPGRSSGTALYGASEVLRAYEIRAFADANAHPERSDCDLCDLIIWDIRRCIEAEGRIPGADSVRYVSDLPGYREDGGTIVGALIEYEIGYTVDLSNPSHSL